MSPRLAPLLLVGVCVLRPAPVLASTIFPAVVTSHWGVEHELPVPGEMGCRLCHTDEVGGAENVKMRFGRLIHEYYGVTKKNAGELEAALDDIRARGWDSDEDGASDYDEIAIDATNPNDSNDHRADLGEGGGSGSSPPVPELAELPPPVGHGCSFQSYANRQRSAAGIPILVALFAAARRRQARVR